MQSRILQGPKAEFSQQIVTNMDTLIIKDQFPLER